jgi:predicted lipid carrier protein YhbT
MSASDSSILPAPPLVFLAMRPLPLAPLQPLLGFLIASIVRRHRGLFVRLGAHSSKRFGIDPTDLPFAFEMAPKPERPRLIAVRELSQGLDVRISGPLGALLGLVNGELDGDALFFSRDLRVEGDFEAVVALRNAVEGAEINLVDEIRSLLGPLGGPFEILFRLALKRLRPESQESGV